MSGIVVTETETTTIVEVGGAQGAQGPAGPEGPAGPSDHTSLTNIGNITHADIDTHINNASIHVVTGTIATQDASSVNITGGTAILDSVQLTGGTGDQGKLTWNPDEETADLILNGSTLQLGQEIHIHARNATGVAISDGVPVMAVGTLGASGRIKIAPMDGTSSSNASFYLGVTTEEILDGSDGKVATFGKVRGIDTSGTAYSETWAEGEVIYISPTTVGALTNVEPSITQTNLPIAFIINTHATNGVLFSRTINIDDNAHISGIGSTVSSGTDGSILFVDSGLLTQDNSNLFWDNTNKRLGIGTTTPEFSLHTTGDILLENNSNIRIKNSSNIANGILTMDTSNVVRIGDTSSNSAIALKAGSIGMGTLLPTAKAHIKGSGSTSATTTLLAQNSTSTDLLKIQDDGFISINGATALLTEKLSVNGDVALSSSDPKLYLGSDFDQYIYGNSAANYLAFFAANVERMRIDSSGGFTLATGGIVIPESKKLEWKRVSDGALRNLISTTEEGVTNSFNIIIGAISSLQKHIKINSGTGEAVRITETGEVGIGEDTPLAKVHVKGNGSTSATTTFLYQNSTGVDLLKVLDDGTTVISGSAPSLSISGSGPNNRMTLENTGSSNATLMFRTNGGDVVSVGANQSTVGNDNYEIYSRVSGSTGSMAFFDVVNKRVGINGVNPITTLSVNGGVANKIVEKTAAYAATISDHTILCDATTASFTVTLHTAASAYDTTNSVGQILQIKRDADDASANILTIDAAGTETIDGSLTQTLSAGESLTLQSTGTKWIVL